MALVLLVDDDLNVRLTLALALRRFGHEVAVAADAETAFELLRLRHFDWVVSDVRMPGLSGVDFAQRVGGMENAPRIVLTSAYSDVAAPRGVVAFFQKPVDARRLSDLLHPPAPSSTQSNAPPATNALPLPHSGTPRNGAQFVAATG